MQPNTAKIIDQTFLKKGASEEEIKKVCLETKQYGFRGLCVYPEHTRLAKESLLESEIKLTTLIDEHMVYWDEHDLHHLTDER